MITKERLLKRLSPWNEDVDVWEPEQNLSDIKRGIVKAHKLNRSEYDKIAPLFIRHNEYETCEYIWQFLRSSMLNVVEGVDDQTLRAPAAMLHTGDDLGIDCKNYALFTGGVLDAINRTGKLYIPFAYRFAKYECNHVFVVAFPNTDDEIWIDAIDDVPYFDYRKEPKYYNDKKISAMALKYMSGFGEGNIQVKDKAAMCRGLIRERDVLVNTGRIQAGSPDDKRYIHALCGMGAISCGELVTMGVFGWDDAIAYIPMIVNLFSKQDNSTNWVGKDWPWYLMKDPATHPANNFLVYWRNNPTWLTKEPWNNPPYDNPPTLQQVRNVVTTAVGMPLTTQEKQKIIQVRMNEAGLGAQATAMINAWNQVYNMDGTTKAVTGNGTTPAATSSSSIVLPLAIAAVVAKVAHVI